MRACHFPAAPPQRDRPWACLTQRVLVAVLALLLVPAPGAVAQPRVGQPAPEVTGERWVNSAPLTMRALRGRVVLVEFWTYG
jgi:hypothetical protein